MARPRAALLKRQQEHPARPRRLGDVEGRTGRAVDSGMMASRCRGSRPVQFAGPRSRQLHQHAHQTQRQDQVRASRRGRRKRQAGFPELTRDATTTADLSRQYIPARLLPKRKSRSRSRTRSNDTLAQLSRTTLAIPRSSQGLSDSLVQSPVGCLPPHPRSDPRFWTRRRLQHLRTPVPACKDAYYL